MIVALVVRIRTTLPAGGLLGKLSAGVIAILTLQVALGLIAYFVLLDETGRIQPSNVQVLANTAHMVIGALLFACTVVLAVLATRARSFSVQSTA
jgi:hypothetical protein